MDNKEKEIAKRLLMAIMAGTLIIGMLVIMLFLVIGKSHDRINKYKKEIKVLKEKNHKLNEERAKENQSYDSRISELESGQQQLSSKNDELESLLSQSGIKEPLKEDEKIVFLTFDDGPSDLTPEFLKVLEENNIKATFFVTYQPEHEDIYKQIADKGNSIQIHTATHDYNAIYSSVNAYVDDFNQINDYVKKLTGKIPKYFRFPGGSTNSYGKSIVREIARTMKDRGLDFVDWNVSVGDGSASATRDSIIQKITAESEGKNHIVMLAHDSGTKTETLAALPQIIEYYRNNGYDFRTIDGNIDMSFAQFIDY